MSDVRSLVLNKYTDRAACSDSVVQAHIALMTKRTQYEQVMSIY